MDAWFRSNNAPKGPPKPLYRGVTSIDHVKNGQMVNRSYSSWTTNLDIARGYASQNGPNGYVLVLKNNNTKGRPYYKFNNKFNKESEIVLAPGTFKVNII